VLRHGCNVLRNHRLRSLPSSGEGIVRQWSSIWIGFGMEHEVLDGRVGCLFLGKGLFHDRQIFDQR